MGNLLGDGRRACGRLGVVLRVAHINETCGGARTAAHLLEFDSVHGRWRGHAVAHDADGSALPASLFQGMVCAALLDTQRALAPCCSAALASGCESVRVFRSGADIVSLRTEPQTPHRGATGFGARLDATARWSTGRDATARRREEGCAR